jgi:hypothetical protein
MKLFCKSVIIRAIPALLLFAVPLAAQDSTAASDSTARADTAAVTAADSTASADTTASLAADSTAPASAKAAADTTAKPKPKKKPRPPGDQVTALIVPWDWDEYTNVIEVGLRREDEREYSLTKNEFYQEVFLNLGLKVLAIGKVTRDSEGFYNMTVDYIEPTDSTQTLATVKPKRP